MSRARTRAFVAAVGALCLIVAALSLRGIGGPETSRRMSRDQIRLGHILELARALRCAAPKGRGPGTAAAPYGVDPACLAEDRARALVDPATGALYRVERPEAGRARVCAAFEAPGRLRVSDAPDAPFDREDGCVSTALRR